MKEFSDDLIGIKFTHPSYWKIEGEPPQYVISAGGVNLMFTATPDAGEVNFPGLIKEKETTIELEGTQAKSFYCSEGGQRVRFIIITYKKMTYAFQVLDPTPRIEKEIEAVLTTISFSRAEILRQPVSSLVCKRFYSKENSFSIEYPTDWTPQVVFNNVEENPACKRLVKFLFEEDEVKVSLTITKQKLPYSVTTTEFCTMIQNHICKTGWKYSSNRDKILGKNTTRFDVLKPDGSKYSYYPVAVEGDGFLLTAKSLHADYLHPVNIFSIVVSSFCFPENSEPSNRSSRKFYNIQPNFNITVPEAFEVKQTFGTEFSHPEFPETSLVILSLDMEQIRRGMPPQIPMSNGYDFLCINWHQNGLQFEKKSEKEVNVLNRRAKNYIVEGKFLPYNQDVIIKSQITCFSTNQYSVLIIWQSPKSTFMDSWTKAGSKIFDSLQN